MDRTVYESRKRKPRRQSRTARASYPIGGGIRATYEYRAGQWYANIPGHSRHLHLNADVSEHTAHDSICGGCGYSVTELGLGERCQCSECGIEAAADRAAVLEDAGIPMGWGWRIVAGEVQQREQAYDREQAVTGGTLVPTSQIDQRYGARRIAHEACA